MTTRDALDDQERWAEVERLFAAAIELPPGTRERWLRAQTGDEIVRREVSAMLSAHDRVAGFLDRLPPLPEDDVRPRLARALAEHYTIISSLGRGGSATVFLAREHKHDRPVVLKVLHPEIAASVGVQRFLSEVRIAAQLSHPHILPLIDSGEVDGLLYYVMPHLEGETLRERIKRRGALPASEAVGLLRDIADALRGAHAAGVVHRDLKPENVLCAGDHAYLLDFGIAVRHTGAGVRHTQEGVVVGTLGYMSPEQTAGRSVGPATDLYAWGVIAREMLTGSGPFTTEHGTPTGPPPPALATLVAQALEEDPAKRPSSAAQIVERLSTLDTSPVTVRARVSKRSRIRLAALASVPVLAVIVIAAMLLRRRDVPPASPIPLPVAVAPLHNETGDTTLAIWGRMAADWITQGLHETSLVQVVPWPSVRHAWEELADKSRGGDGAPTVPALAGEIGAGTVVSGSYYLAGNRVGFRLDVTDARNNKLLGSLQPIVVSRDSLEVAIHEARDRLMGFIAVELDERSSSLPGLTTRPPTFSAYRAFDRGLALYNQQEYAAAATEFRHAWNADTTFPVPLIYAAMAHWNRDEHEWVDTLVAMAAQRRDRLSEYDRLQVEYLSALLASDGARATAAGTRAVAIAPESRAAYNLGRDLIAMDRAEEGRRVLEGINPDRGLMKGWPSYWTQLAHARHLMGAHDAELEAARSMRTRFPESRVAWVLEARALAAAGRTRALDSLLLRTAKLPAATYWSHGAALVVAGEELIVHGDSVLGKKYLVDAAAWLERELRGEPKRRDHRYWLGSAYYDQARWREADSIVSSLHRDFPDRSDHRSMAALTRARMGDTPGARRLLGDAPRFARGEHTAYSARLASIVGDTASARALRLRALSEVATGYAWVHASGFRDLAKTPR
jgi:serine/threonine protein kinase/tetratricopeptide (TPR) repeat protein